MGFVRSASAFPDPDSNGAMLYSPLHAQPLQGGLFARDNHIYIVPTAQTAIGDKEQRIRVGRQVDPDNICLFVHHMINKAGVLVAETVMVLPPNVRSQQVVERRDTPPPGDVPCCLQPFRVLVKHGVNDVNESFVAGKETMTSVQQQTLEPPLPKPVAQRDPHRSDSR